MIDKKLCRETTTQTAQQHKTEIKIENISVITKQEKIIKKTYDTKGIILGACAGLAVGLLFPFNIILIVEIGMFIGALAGSAKKKE